MHQPIEAGAAHKSVVRGVDLPSCRENSISHIVRHGATWPLFSPEGEEEEQSPLGVVSIPPLEVVQGGPPRGVS